MTPTLDTARGSLWTPRRRWTSVSLVLAIGVVAFDELGVTTALPRIAAELGGLGTYGWAVSAVVLATVVGSAVAGRVADRRGPAMPSAAGFAVFALGLTVSVAATGWAGFLAGRAIQGLGAGAVVATVYVVLTLRLPAALRSRGLALVSSAWTIPALVGPGLSGLVTEWLGWRAVFGLLLVLTALSGCVSAAVNRHVDANRPVPDGEAAPASTAATTWWACALALSVTAVLAGLEQDRLPVAVLLGGVGIVGAGVAVGRLTPAGTRRARRGLPAGVAARALLAAGYFGASTFLALLLVEVRGADATLAGIVLAVGSLGWTAGAVLQARTDRGGLRRAQHVRLGYTSLVGGLTCVGVVLLATPWPAAVAAVGWAAAGLGMGLAYNVTTAATLDLATSGNYGDTSSALQIAQTLGIAGTAGAGTTVLAHASGDPVGGFAVVLAVAVVCAVLGFPLARRTMSRPTSPGE